jgi:hypothetical protein
MSKTVDNKLKQMNLKIDKLSQLTKTVETLAASVKKLAEVAELAVAHRQQEQNQQTNELNKTSKAMSEAQKQEADKANSMQLIDAELKKNEVQRAFWIALNEGNYDLVKWTCSKLTPDQVVGKVDQLVLLSLTQQLGVNIGEDVQTNLSWLQQCVIGLDPQNVQINQHMPSVFETVMKALDKNSATYVSTDHPLRAQYQLVQHLFKSTATILSQKR